MKGKTTLALVCISIASTSALAIDIQHGKLLKHKEWTTGNVTKTAFTVKPSSELLKLKKPVQATNLSSSDHFGMSYSKGNNAVGNQNERGEVTGFHAIQIHNSSNGSQRYRFDFSICAETSSNTTACSFYSDEIELDTGGIAMVALDSIIDPLFTDSGDFKTFSSTFLSAYDNELNSYVPHSASTSESTITIAEAKKANIH